MILPSLKYDCGFLASTVWCPSSGPWSSYIGDLQSNYVGQLRAASGAIVNSLSTQLKASTSGGNAQIAIMIRLMEELTQKNNSQQTQMKRINAENQTLRNQLTTLITQAAYSYYYSPYVRYSARTSVGG